MGQDTAAIVLAGGQGVRFGGPVRKQYLTIGGKPLLWWSLSAFERASSIRDIVAVVPREDLDVVQSRVRRWSFSKVRLVAAGGVTRAASVRNGLEVLPAGTRYVAVHDAVRPLVTPDIVEETIRAARRFKASLAACPSKDTVKVADAKGFVRASPPRETVWLAQTPQTFERRLLEKAHRQGAKVAVTDDAQLVERLGVRVRLVQSPPENIKVTVPSDLKIAKSILRGRR